MISRLEPQAGYTLLEFLVVIAIMVVLTGTATEIALPLVRSFQMSARSQSIVFRLSEAHELAVENRARVDVRPATLQHLGVGVKVACEASDIVFYADGSASDCVVTLGSGQTKEIFKVDPITGLTHSQ